jgi:hypothetical protein
MTYSECLLVRLELASMQCACAVSYCFLCSIRGLPYFSTFYLTKSTIFDILSHKKHDFRNFISQKAGCLTSYLKKARFSTFLLTKSTILNVLSHKSKIFDISYYKKHDFRHFISQKAGCSTFYLTKTRFSTFHLIKSTIFDILSHKKQDF